MTWADHVVILYPLWLGSMPALLKALLEQVLRPGFAYSTLKLGKWPVKFLSGKTARIVITMGMPAPIYRWYFRATACAACSGTFSSSSASGPSARRSSAMSQASARRAHAVARRFARPRALGGVSSPRGAQPERAFSRLCNFRS